MEAPAPRVIEPPQGFALPSLRELWEERDLLYFLARREISGRYRQSVIGAFWAVLQPLLFAAVFSVFFGNLAHVPSEHGVAYVPFALSGMVLWLFFAGAMSSAAASTVANETLVSKVYFPRVIIPLASVFPPLIDFCVAFCVVVVTILAYGITPPIQIVLMPFVVVLTLTAATGAGLWFSALNVRYRDVKQLLPFIVLVGLFVSPITYPIHLVPHDVRAIYALNPMVGVLEAYRWMLFPGASWPGAIVLISIAVSMALLVSGALYFQRAESAFADVI
jgi:lipopolysaccharide transport system permease protein